MLDEDKKSHIKAIITLKKSHIKAIITLQTDFYHLIYQRECKDAQLLSNVVRSGKARSMNRR